MLLVGVAGKNVAAHAVAGHEATAIYALITGAAPQVGDVEECPRMCGHDVNGKARIERLVFAHGNGGTCEPGVALAG